MVDVSDEKVLTRSQKKNIRKKQKKKDSKQNEYAFEIEEVICPMEEMKISEVESPKESTTTPAEKVAYPDGQQSTEAIRKKIRTLKKKLKQIEELEEKVQVGDIIPNREQINKLSKKEEVVDEIKALGAVICTS